MIIKDFDCRMFSYSADLVFNAISGQLFHVFETVPENILNLQ
jgi:hypothetical protein